MPPLTLTPGTRLGPYEILSALGAGGMGEVYRATDTKLKRQVAIKVLPAALTTDHDRLARFQREAEVLASLNHPNIAAIYGLEEGPAAAGHHASALVMELVEGPTLADRIAQGAIPLDEALAIAEQLADALDAAHERGIVHRDLKPANIKITPDGVAKVLDFGLAKSGGPVGAGGSDGDALTHSPTMMAPTASGVLLGTAPYMSPEQARGKAVDKRTDIWAFGCVLYEMLTGRRPFTGETTTDVLAQIVEREPDWSLLPVSTPAHSVRLIKRCLEKDPKRRLRDIGDAGTELASTADDGVARATRRARIPAVWTVLAALATTVAVILGALVARGPQASRGAGRSTSTSIAATQLTNYGVSETSGALSPDGRSFAFASGHGGTPDIWLRQVAGGDPVRLTNDDAEESDVVYAADGESLFYTRIDRSGPAIWRMGALGGQPRKVVADARVPSPSHDGRRLAYYVPSASEFTLSVSATDGSAARTLVPALPGGMLNVRPAWSRDGRWVSYSTSGLFAPRNMMLVDVDTGAVRQVTHYTHANEGVGQHLWLPDNRHVLTAYGSGGQQTLGDLAVLDVEDGTLTRLTVAVGSSFAPTSLSGDGSRLLATATNGTGEVWRVPFGPDSDENGRRATRVMDSTWNPLWTYVTRDGGTLLFNSPINGSRNLWTAPTTFSSPARQITAFGGSVVSHSSLSPDRARVAFASLASGASEIWMQNVDGSGLRQLTSDGAAHSWPVWSPDGRWIVFNSLRGMNNETWRAEVDGGATEKLRDGFFRGDWANRPGGGGTWLVTTREAAGLALLMDVERRIVIWESRQPTPGTSLPMFSPDARMISAPSRETRDHDVIWVIDAATGQARIGARLSFHVAFRANWIEDGTAFLVNKQETEAHVVLFDHVWAPEQSR